LNMVISVR